VSSPRVDAPAWGLRSFEAAKARGEKNNADNKREKQYFIEPPYK
jgi:hypothetical protein